MIEEKLGRAIETANPTDVNANLTQNAGTVCKIGNVVSFRLRFQVDTAFTPSEVTVICYMPYKPLGDLNWIMVNRASGLVDSTPMGIGLAEIESTGRVCWGTSPYDQVTVGERIWICGTYLTND